MLAIDRQVTLNRKASGVDPTGTTQLRMRYERALVARYRRLKALARKAILIDDVFGLQPLQDSAPRIYLAMDANMTPAMPKQFAGFTRSQDKAHEFTNWLEQQAAAGVLDIVPGDPVKHPGDKSWRSVYIDSAYKKGMRDSYFEGSDLPRGNQAIKAAFLRPTHADKVGILYSRNLEDLKGINAEMSKQIRSTLAQGLVDGRHPQQLARIVSNRVDKIGITRARVLARTEMVSAYAESTLNSFQEAGVKNVRTEAEFSTSKDDRVCPQCSALQGTVYSLEDARGVIPLHPNCRCAWLPVKTIVPSSGIPETPQQLVGPSKQKSTGLSREQIVQLREKTKQKVEQVKGTESQPLTEEKLPEHFRGLTERQHKQYMEGHIDRSDYYDPERYEGIEKYVDIGYADLTEALYYGKALTHSQKLMMSDLENLATKLAKKTYKRNPTLFRGLKNLDKLDEVFEADKLIFAKAGDEILLKAPSSFSSRGDIASRSFARAQGKYRNVDNMMIELHTPNGGRAVVTNAAEAEYIIMNEQKLRIVENRQNVKIETTDWKGNPVTREFRNYVVAELIP